MSTQKTRQVAVTKKWDDYVKEASKPDFVVEVPGEDDIVIKNPTGDQSRIARDLGRDGELEEMLFVMCGKQAADRLWPMLMAAPAGVLNAFTDDVMAHFIGDQADQGNSPASTD